MVDILNNEEQNYDAVWISNSIWLYMLNNSYLVTDSKSIAINPVVMGITKSKATELGFVDNKIYNKDILDAISNKKLNYVMTSVTKTNTGATAYLGFLNSLAGSPEILTNDMIKSESLVNDMRTFFKGVDRVSGDEEYLTQLFLNGKYDAIINNESTLINLNKKLEAEKKEPLYLIYPVDGVPINDMPFAYVSRGQNERKKSQFKKLQDYLRSNEVRKKLEELGFRSWYGGINENANSSNFRKEWGINTEEYLISLKYPSKEVMDNAINLYIEELRKPTHIVFCLDVSGSMYGEGLEELKEAMNYVLDYDEAKKDKLQFSKHDKITIITFSNNVNRTTNTYTGLNTNELINFVNGLNANGGTNIYDPSIKALNILKSYDSSEYTRTIILMTDGKSNNGSYYNLREAYLSLRQDIPIYSITFGSADEKDLENVASLTNGKVFNGKLGLKKAFEEVRSYN